MNLFLHPAARHARRFAAPAVALQSVVGQFLAALRARGAFPGAPVS